MSDRLVADDVRVRVFLEGVYFPYVANLTVNSTAKDVYCNLEIPSSPSLRPEIMYGMTVHIFYANRRVLGVTGRGGDRGPSGPTRWPILFQGEVRHVDAATSVNSKNFTLQCVSHSRHFDQTHLYFLDPDQENSLFDFKNRVIFLGNNTYVPNVGKGPLEIKKQFRQKLKERIEQFDQTSGDRFIALAGMNSDILRMADGNAAFRIMDERFKLNQRFGSFIDPDVGKILSLQEYDQMLGERGGQLPTYASVREVQNILTDMMHYDWIHVAQPHFSVAGERAIADANSRIRGPIADSKRTQVTKSDVVYDADRVSKREVTRIEDSVDEVITESVAGIGQTATERVLDLPVGPVRFYPGYFDGGPNVTVIQPKRLMVQTVVDRMESLGESAQDAFQATVSAGHFPQEADANSKATETEKAQRQKDREFVKNLKGDQGQVPSVDRPQDVTKIIRTERERVNSKLNEFISVPNLEFSQPPRCNVIMPHNMSHYGIQIDHFGGPTRLYGIAKFLKDGPTEFYLAPTATTYFHVEDNRLKVWNDQYRKRNIKFSKRKAEKVSK